MALSTITTNTKITASTFNAVVNAVNSIQTATPKAYITETWISGSSWYRKWSDGWIEQGGYKTGLSNGSVVLTFHLAFLDTNYTCVTFPRGGCAGGGHWIGSSSQASSTISLAWDGAHGDPSGIMWYACRILINQREHNFQNKGDSST